MSKLKINPCSKCGKSAPAVTFNRNKNTKDGWNYWCVECKQAGRPQTICRVHYRPNTAKALFGRYRALCQVRVSPEYATPFMSNVTCGNCLKSLLSSNEDMTAVIGSKHDLKPLYEKMKPTPWINPFPSFQG